MTRSTPLYALKLLLRNAIICLLWVTLHSTHLIPVAAAQAKGKPSVPLAERIQDRLGQRLWRYRGWRCHAGDNPHSFHGRLDRQDADRRWCAGFG